MSIKILSIGLVVVAIIAIIGLFTPVGKTILGAVTGETNYNTVGVSGLKVGSSCNDSFSSTAANGCTKTAHLMLSSCSMIANVSITATTTGYAYCTGVTGVTSSDKIFANFATSTAGFTVFRDNWTIVNAKASSTAGSIDFDLYNGTGATQAPSAIGQAGSSTQLFIIQ